MVDPIDSVNPGEMTDPGGGMHHNVDRGALDRDVVEVEPVEAIEVFGERVAAARRYVELLADQGIEWGLIGPREKDRLWTRHVLNSAALAEVIPAGAEVVDVGSGAGLPGIPLALARPDLSITLLEPMERRVNFLDLVVEEFDLSERVEVVRGRAEDNEGDFDVVTCRAVGPLSRLLTWCLPLLSPTGELIALKGSSAPKEVAGVRKELRKNKLQAEIVSVRAHPAAEATTAVRITRG